jgi:hypothetical protein
VLDHIGAPVHPVGLPPPIEDDPLCGDDLHLALYVCYELHYRGFTGVDPSWEWEPTLLAFRRRIESAFETALFAEAPRRRPADVPRQLAEMVAAGGPSLSRYMEERGTRQQFEEFAIHRSAYQLKEADPHTWGIPRLVGGCKSAMVEIQADEYGGGAPERMHSELFAGMMRDLGLDAGYGALWDDAPALAFASVNTMSLFGLNRRWRGAALGHLAVVEMTSSEPSRRYAAGLRRLGFDERTTVFYDEHVEADAVHEQIASVDMCGSLVRAEPALLPDVLFGAAASLAVDGLTARHLLGAWEAGRSALRGAAPLAA